jgi:uncharacterized protein (TIGR02117 family)
LRLARRGLSQWLWLVLAGLLAACASLPPPPPATTAGPPAVAIVVVQRGWHTDVAVPAERLDPPLAALRADMPGARWLVFGFGESAFLQNRSPSLTDTLMALLPSPGAILLTGLSASPAEAFGAANVQALVVSQAGFEQLQRFLWHSLAQPDGQPPQPLAEGPYAGGLFYASGVTYAGFYTCNTWTAEALQQAGLPVSAKGIVLAGQVMDRAHQMASPEH